MIFYQGGINVYKIPLIKVKKVTGVEIFSKHCYCELTQQEVVEYYNSMISGFCGRMYPTELEEKLGIFDVPNSSDEEDYANTYEQDTKLREYIESKNPEIRGKKSGTLEACKPVSNPLMFSEAHDGVHMHALLEDNEIVSYWGD